MVLVGLFFCVGDEENGHHACMNGHLTTAHQHRDMCTYSGGWGKVVGGYAINNEMKKTIGFMKKSDVRRIRIRLIE